MIQWFAALHWYWQWLIILGVWLFADDIAEDFGKGIGKGIGATLLKTPINVNFNLRASPARSTVTIDAEPIGSGRQANDYVRK